MSKEINSFREGISPLKMSKHKKEEKKESKEERSASP